MLVTACSAVASVLVLSLYGYSLPALSSLTLLSGKVLGRRGCLLVRVRFSCFWVGVERVGSARVWD